MNTIGEDAKEAKVSIALILHPGQIVIKILRHPAIRARDETQIHQEVVAEFELLLTRQVGTDRSRNDDKWDKEIEHSRSPVE